MLSPTEARLRASLAAHALHAQGGTNTGPARAAFRSRFLKEVDPDGVLPEDERLRRAEHARKVHYTRLALASAKVRRERAELVEKQRRGQGLPAHVEEPSVLRQIAGLVGNRGGGGDAEE